MMPVINALIGRRQSTGGRNHLPWTIAVYCGVKVVHMAQIVYDACGDDRHHHGAVTRIRESVLKGYVSLSVICVYIKWELQSHIFF